MLNAQDTSVDPALLQGEWQVDLRPAPDAPPYWQTLKIKANGGKTFSGQFYGSKFRKGLLNNQWAEVYLAFETRDRNHTYYHTARFDGKVIHGQTYCPERAFIAPWSAKRVPTIKPTNEP